MQRHTWFDRADVERELPIAVDQHLVLVLDPLRGDVVAVLRRFVTPLLHVAQAAAVEVDTTGWVEAFAILEIEVDHVHAVQEEVALSMESCVSSLVP